MAPTTLPPAERPRVTPPWPRSPSCRTRNPHNVVGDVGILSSLGFLGLAVGDRETFLEGMVADVQPPRLPLCNAAPIPPNAAGWPCMARAASMASIRRASPLPRLERHTVASPPYAAVAVMLVPAPVVGTPRRR